MAKCCDKCQQPYKGFGTTCSTCRKGGPQAQAPTKMCDRCSNWFTGYTDICKDCKAGNRQGGPLPTPKDVDDVLAKIDCCIHRMDLVQGSQVKHRQAELNLLDELERARCTMESIIRSRDRVLLRETLIECSRVARLATLTESVKLTGQNTKDRRLENCKATCRAVEELLAKDYGMAAELAKSQADAEKKLIKARVSVLMDMDDAPPHETMRFGGQNQEEEWQEEDWGYGWDGEDWGWGHGWGWEEWDEDDDELLYCDQGEILDKDASDPRKQDTIPNLKSTLLELFNKLDKDKSGSLSKNEVMKAGSDLAPLMKKCRIRKRKHVLKMFKEGDTDHDGSVDFEEFVTYIEKAIQAAENAKPPPMSEAQVRNIFEAMDTDYSGSITEDELRYAYAAILLSTGEKVGKKRVDKWVSKNFKKYDTDGSKTLSFEEFRELLEHSGAMSSLKEEEAAAARQHGPGRWQVKARP